MNVKCEPLLPVLQSLLQEKKHVLLIGAPGSGKSWLVRTVYTKLAEMWVPTKQEASEVFQTYCQAGLATVNYKVQLPFQAPHRTASAMGFTGTWCEACQRGRPGVLALAHHGILFLDDVEEYRRDALAAVADALRSGYVCIGVTGAWRTQFTLVAAASSLDQVMKYVPEKMYACCVILNVEEGIEDGCKDEDV